MTLASKIFYYVGWGVIAVAMTIMLTGIWWMVSPQQGLINVKQPFPVSQHVVAPGSLLRYTVSYCVDSDLPLPITINREIELQGPDNTRLPVSPAIQYVITERCETRTLMLGVPSFIPDGEYHIHAFTTLKVNPLREVRQSFVSDMFQVASPVK